MALKVTIMPLDIDADAKPTIQTIDKEEITIGRLPSNDIVLNRPEVSGIHARLRVDTVSVPNQSKLFITDLGSSNGTMVEKNPLRPRVEVAMLSNERIFIGNFVIKPVIEVESLVSTEAFSIPEGTTEMRRNYLAEALKEYEEKSNAEEDSEEIEERIERFTEERAVGNGAPFSHSASSHVPQEPSVSVSTSASISALFSSAHTADKHTSSEEEEETYSQYNEEDSLSDEGGDTSESLYPTVGTTLSDVGIVSQYPIMEEKPDTSSHVFSAKQSLPSSENQSNGMSFKVKVEGGDILSYNFTAAAFATLRGKVMHKGMPLSGVIVSALNHKVFTDAEGNFEFPKVLEGTEYVLSFEKEKFVFEPSELKGKLELDVSPLTSYATQLFSISGVVSHHGKPLSGVTVDGGPLGTVLTGPDGRYTFENVPEGQEYNLTLSKEGYAFIK